MSVDETMMARALDDLTSPTASAVRAIEGFAEISDGVLAPEEAADALLLAAGRKLLRVHGARRAVEKLRAAAVVIERGGRA